MLAYSKKYECVRRVELKVSLSSRHPLIYNYAFSIFLYRSKYVHYRIPYYMLGFFRYPDQVHQIPAQRGTPVQLENTAMYIKRVSSFIVDSKYFLQNKKTSLVYT